MDDALCPRCGLHLRRTHAAMDDGDVCDCVSLAEHVRLLAEVREALRETEAERDRWIARVRLLEARAEVASEALRARSPAGARLGKALRDDAERMARFAARSWLYRGAQGDPSIACEEAWAQTWRRLVDWYGSAALAGCAEKLKRAYGRAFHDATRSVEKAGDA